MCTCLEIENGDKYFGRTLDLEYHYNEEAVITPRNYSFYLQNGELFKTKYALIGTAMVMGPYPLYYEAANECGLACAGLNFPNNAYYNKPNNGKLNLTPFELIPYFLGKFQSIKELRSELEKLNITSIDFNEGMPLSPLHFMFTDLNESIVVEQTESGLNVYENKVGVMTNNPPFPKQLQNIKKYKNIDRAYVESDNKEDSCVGLGAIGLPGDFSSESRFVKIAFLRHFSESKKDEESNVTQFFHLLDGVSMPYGFVLTKNEKRDFTFYTSCINLNQGIFYYKTYYNNQITSLKLTDENKNANSLIRHPLSIKQNINALN